MVAFLSGAVLTAANLNSAFNALTFRAVTGTSDTFVLADNGGAVSYSNASAITATVPPFSSVAYADGTVIQLLNLGAGVVTVTAGVGVTLNGSKLTLAQNTGGTLIKTATNTWYFLPSAPNGPGMDLINTTSLSGSAVSVNSVFTATYAHYFLTIDAVLGSSAFIQMRLRAAGSDSSTAIYDRQASTARSTVLAGNALATDTKINVTFSGAAGTNIARLDVFNPQAALQTGVLVMGGQLAPEMGIGRYIYTATTSFDGFSLFPDTGTFTSGTVRTYGLRNS